MNRRTFLQRGTLTAAGAAVPGNGNPFDAQPVRSFRTSGVAGTASAAGLTAWVPSAAKPWNARRAAHLLRRTGFGVTWAQIDAALTNTPGQLIQAMLQSAALPSPPGTWATQTPKDITNDTRQEYYGWARDMQEWWFNLMLQPAGMLREKMVLFWHNHFVSEFPTVIVTQFMYMQNQLFRERAFGDFRELTKKVTIDPAMLIYLDGATSRAGNPNENYARELLELFTLGAGSYGNGSPHYTEHDIVELARALTGWTVPARSLTNRFEPARFDDRAKTIFGQSANFGIEGKGARDVIDLVFEQSDPDHDRKRAAIYLCEKLYRYFVSQTPDMAIVAEMAGTLEANNWRIEPVLGQLLGSEHFFDENVMGSIIKSPLEFTAGSMRELELTPQMARVNMYSSRVELHDPIVAMTTLSQALLYPPNVKGWIGGREWISSATMPLRIRYSKMWVEPVTGALPYGFDPSAFVTAIPDNDDVDKVLEHFIELLLPIDLSQETKDLLLNELLAGGMKYEWKPEAPNSIPRIRACLIRMTNLAEYQLM